MNAYQLRSASQTGLPQVLKNLHSEFPDLLFSTLDCTVRALNPDRHVVHQEAYRAACPDATGRDSHLQRFVDQGFSPKWWRATLKVFVWALRTHVPSMGTAELADLAWPSHQSVFARFFSLHVAAPAVETAVALRKYMRSPIFGGQGVQGHWADRMRDDPSGASLGEKFFRRLLGNNPQLMDYFKNADMDTLSLHIVRALDIMVTSAPEVRVPGNRIGRLQNSYAEVEA